MEYILIYILLGLVIGFVGGYAGIGGSPFMIAFLVLLLGMSQLSAQGTVLTAMLGPMSLLGILTLKDEVSHQWKAIIIGTLSYAFFSYFGAKLAFLFGEVHLRHFFAYFLIFIALLELFSNTFPFGKEEVDNIKAPWILFVSALTGIIGGLFGIGAGVLMIPIFMIFFHLKKNYARALSLAILLPPVSLGAFIEYLHKGAISWTAVFFLFFSYFFANYFGARLGKVSRKETFRIVYAILLMSIAILYLL